MFHFEINDDHTEIILKDSENYIKDAITGWLQLHTKPSFITNNEESFGFLARLAEINLDDHNTTVVGTDKEDLSVIEKTKKLKETYKLGV